MAQVQDIAKVVRADAASGIRRNLSSTWTKAAGILSTRKSKLEKHIRAVRKEWSRG